MKGVRAVSTANMSREEWLAKRRKTIGGSDAAGIIGLSKFSTPFSVWADKTGRLPDKPDNEAMRQGRDLEEYVAQRFTEETGKKVRRLRALLYNDKYPFAHADIDRDVVGEKAGLECKSSSTLDTKQFAGGEFPTQYYAQCVHYLAVTGMERWYLAVLVLGRGFYTFTLERNQAEIDALMGAEAAFWENVTNDTPPAVDGKEATTDALQVIYADGGAGCVDLFGRDAMLEEYAALKRQKKAIDERIDEIANDIKAEMGEAEEATCGAQRITWKPQVRRTFQQKAFAADYPQIDLSGYFSESRSRVFKIYDKKE